ncbi:MAG: hypothetical protein ABJA78_15030, partial [Ferruginibacter sp.]
QDYLLKFSTEAEQLQALEALAAEHPYFTPAQFHLLLLKKEDDPEYNKLAAKNAALFNNPLWLNFQLGKYRSKKEIGETVPEKPGENIIPVTEEKVIPAEEEKVLPDEEKETLMVYEPESAAANDANDTDAVEETAAVEEKTGPLLKDILTQPSTGIPDELPAFQPLYSTDYFASQGIKLSEEVSSADKLGRQLKSFTEWLKTMKKVHPENIPVPEATTASVQVQAEKSNADDDVITEAMAEVFVLQNKSEKAADIYRKLSLLNPAKSAFFAAKIEQLKRN